MLMRNVCYCSKWIESWSEILSGPESQPEMGNTLPLSRVPLGTVIVLS
jgi:ribosomal protein L2